jgi:hypothetical protein
LIGCRSDTASNTALEANQRELADTQSALGSLFDGININGSWDIQMWASLSKAYATHAAAHVGQATYSGLNSRRPASIALRVR